MNVRGGEGLRRAGEPGGRRGRGGEGARGTILELVSNIL